MFLFETLRLKRSTSTRSVSSVLNPLAVDRTVYVQEQQAPILQVNAALLVLRQRLEHPRHPLVLLLERLQLELQIRYDGNALGLERPPLREVKRRGEFKVRRAGGE